MSTALGLLALVGAMNGVVGLGESVAILAFGLLFLLLTFLQRRGEQRR